MAIVTLSFLIKDNKILMINRNKAPFMGMWNCVGGHVEEGEDAKAGAIREIKEEANIEVDDATLISISTWNYDDDLIYVYVSRLPHSFNEKIYPLKINEGIIDFKEIDCSSTSFRQLKDKNLVTSEVYEYIKDNNLYL